MIYLGIDPGKKGGIAAVDDAGKLFFVPRDTPLADGDYDLNEMLEMVRAWDLEYHVTIEQCQPFPKIGANANFQVGRGFGLWLGLLAACRVRHSVVHASTWHKELCKSIQVAKGVKKPSKVKARIAAERLWPGVFKATQDGLIDAALLAEFGRRENH